MMAMMAALAASAATSLSLCMLCLISGAFDDFACVSDCALLVHVIVLFCLSSLELQWLFALFVMC